MNYAQQLARLPEFVTEHSKLVIAAMLVATLLVGSGITAVSGGETPDLASDSPAANASAYVSEGYEAGAKNTTVVGVYVRDEGGNVLSKDSLLASLRYQSRVRDADAVASKLVDRNSVVGVANAVARRLSGGSAVTPADRIDTLESASPAAVERAVERSLTEESRLIALMPSSYEPGTATADSRRMVFRFASDGGSARRGAVPDAQSALYDAASDADAGADYFMLSGPAMQDVQRELIGDTMELVGPVALVFVLVALAVAYRDLVDVLVGFLGVALTLVWMLGLIGWFDVPFTQAGIVAPILIIGLSIDYGIHVFMRYREERDAEDDVRESMRTTILSVGTALVLVTLTTAIGFLSNLTNSLASIRSLALATSLGIVAALVVFVTLVPALKVEVDGAIEKYLGRTRTASAFGVGGASSRVLGLGARAARRAPRAILVLAVLTSAAGAYGVTTLESRPSEPIEQPAEWKSELPDPLGTGEYPYAANSEYVRENYRSTGDRMPVQVLVRGDVTDPAVLEGIDEATAAIRSSDPLFRAGDGSSSVRTPLSVLRRSAARYPTVGEAFERADTDGDGVPETRVRELYDALFSAAPTAAAEVIEREGDEYRSLRLVAPMKRGADYASQSAVATTAAATVEGDGATVSAVATGEAVVAQAEVREIRSNIFLTLAVALAAVILLLSVVYRFLHGSATLGAITGVNVVFVLTYVFGAMKLLGVPLTLFTSLMVSLAVGLGIDYSIHVTHRYVEELEDNAPAKALQRTVAGTGGALLGSTATTVGAFGSLSLATFAQFRNMGILVALSLLLSLLTALVVVPAFLVVWSNASKTGTADVLSRVPTRGD
jgi:predicted RND superfamily exporter protein